MVILVLNDHYFQIGTNLLDRTLDSILAVAGCRKIGALDFEGIKFLSPIY
jgi:hypothetical protein